MATAPTIYPVPWSQPVSTDQVILTWALQAGEFGDPAQYSEFADRSVQIQTAGGTGILQGSNDGVNWATLTTPDGTPISSLVSGLFQVSEATRYIRAGAAGAAVTFTVFMRRQRRGT